MSTLPYQNIRILEKSTTIAGRLLGLLFADQGAEVIIPRDKNSPISKYDNYFDRNKIEELIKNGVVGKRGV
jgi:crotonobetainyl-CoA:carnitine CoA-transferase CaiB-like acyl-CoA transferase